MKNEPEDVASYHEELAAIMADRSLSDEERQAAKHAAWVRFAKRPKRTNMDQLNAYMTACEPFHRQYKRSKEAAEAAYHQALKPYQKEHLEKEEQREKYYDTLAAQAKTDEERDALQEQREMALVEAHHAFFRIPEVAMARATFQQALSLAEETRQASIQEKRREFFPARKIP